LMFMMNSTMFFFKIGFIEDLSMACLLNVRNVLKVIKL